MQFAKGLGFCGIKLVKQPVDGIFKVAGVSHRRSQLVVVIRGPVELDVCGFGPVLEDGLQRLAFFSMP